MIRQEQCDKVCRILDDVLANRPTERDSLIVAVQKAFDALEKQRWIPCSERLPKDVEIGKEYPTVIFSTKDAVYCGFYEYYLGGNWWAAEEYKVDNVVAWMPLPEPARLEDD